VNKLVAASVAYDSSGLQPEFKAMIPQMTVEMFLHMPFGEQYRKLSPTPDSFPALVRKVIAAQREPLSWGEDVKRVKTPVLLIAGDEDGYRLEHIVSLFRLLGGGAMGDMGKPLPASRLAIVPGTSHTAVFTQVDVVMRFVEPFLNGETPKGFQ
jgi:pimeloyl-ACP methyl ester carboxylesterase